VEARLQGLEANWAKFDAQHDKLLAHREAIIGSDYVKQDLPSLTEEAYMQQKGALLDLVRSLKAKEPTVATSESTGAETAAPVARTTLPRIQLPHFSGNYEDWPAFRDLFRSIIDRDLATTQVEKLHYLKTCLKGEAELLVRNLATTAENYERAWKILSDYYEIKRLLSEFHIVTKDEERVSD